MNTFFNVKLDVLHSVHTGPGHSQKKEISPRAAGCYFKKSKLKSVKSVSCVTPLSCVNPVINAPNVVTNLPVGARLQNFWKKWLDLRAGPRVAQILKEGYTLPFRIRPYLSRISTVISCYGNPHRNLKLLEALHQLMDKNAIELVHKQVSLGFFNRLFLVPKPNNKWRPILDLSNLNSFLKTEKFKMETPETIRTSLQKGEWVTSIDFKDAYFHIPIQEQSRKYLRFHIQGQTYQFKALPFGSVDRSHGVYYYSKRGKTDGHSKRYKDPPIPDWLVRARSHRVCLQHTQVLVKMCRHLGWLVNIEKSELEPKQVFNFVGYQFDLESGCVRPTPDRWQSLQEKILELISLPACSVREFMSLIGLLTATEKQVHLGRLHMRPIQWHLKSNWRIPELLEKLIPLPRSLHPHLQWWLKEDNVLTGQPLHPIQHALQIFTDASKEAWGAHLNEFIARGTWSLPESKLHINYLELKAVFLALKEFQNLCVGKMVLIATDNTTVVSYINKEGGMRSGPLCPTLENLDLVHLETSDSKGPTHSRPLKCSGRQTVQIGTDHPNRMVPPSRGFSSPVQQVAPASNRSLCYEIQQQVAPVGRSPVPDPMATAEDALSLSWENLDAYAFPPTAILGKVVEKLQDSPYQRLIIIAQGWPNITWFWDLVEMSSQIPLLLPQLPNLLAQPFNQTPHRSLTNLNLHAWLLEPQLSRTRVSLRRWQQELRLLKEDQPDPSMRQSGPFSQSGASQIRWTSGYCL